jgi:hypothetical protein
MDNLLNATIEITEEAGKQKGQYGLIIKFKGKNLDTGKLNTYTVYQTKADGSVSVAWEQYEKLSIGDTVEIGYQEQTGQAQDGSPFTRRVVRNFNPDIGNGRKQYASSQTVPKPAPGGKSEATEPIKDAAFWERQAYEKCCSIWIAAMLGKLEQSSAVIGYVERGAFWDIFQAIKKDGEKRFASGWAKAEAIYKEGPVANAPGDTADIVTT